MNIKKKNLLAMGGVIGVVVGVVGAIPSLLKENHIAATLYFLLLIIGLILLAISFGEEK